MLSRTLLTLLQSPAVPPTPPPSLPVYVDYGPAPVIGRIVGSLRWSARLAVTARTPRQSAGVSAVLRLPWSARLSATCTVPHYRAAVAGGLRWSGHAAAGCDLSAPLAQLRAADAAALPLLIYALAKRRAA